MRTRLSGKIDYQDNRCHGPNRRSGFPHSFATCPSGLSISIGLAAFSPTSGRLGFSPDWPGSPLLGSCGPGREKTPFSHELPATASIPVGRFLTFNAVILDSQRPRARAKPRPRAGWQEITALSYRQYHPADHQPRREPSGFRQSVRASTHLYAIFRKVSADTGLAEVGVLSRSAKYEVQGRIGADTLAKWDQVGWRLCC